ncbi:transmembrane 9 superfamily member 2-like isoform X2 [Gordionus sp. m RMFG-2023]|uniref:transmembrane 9 superfamily member 2-like isoform X2 n=1 Tax=Gordionus sp. m RMFG-2023 TaxID=3053472 RepID=UPI0031FD8D87
MMKLGMKSEIPVFVNILDSEKTVIPYEYHRFDFCLSDESKSPSENLGQIFLGDRIRPSPYEVYFLKDLPIKTVCTKKYSSSKPQDVNRANFLKMGIKLDYQQHWIIDNLPFLWCYVAKNVEYCSRSFPIGFYTGEAMDKEEISQKFNINPDSLKPNTYYMFNYLKIIVTYNPINDYSNSKRGRIISAKIIPFSFKDPNAMLKGGDVVVEPLIIPEKLVGDFEIPYSYSVNFEVNDKIKWSSRWDYVMYAMPQANIQWFSIMNALVIILFLSGMVGMILLRTLRRDIARYNQIDAEDVQEEYGWKLVHGDVFRPPKRGILLSVFLGSGTQIMLMALITLIFACLGFLSPANRGALMTCALVLYVCLGTPAGYVSARIYKSFHGYNWKTNILLTGCLCPGIVFAVFFALNLLLWTKGSSAAVPFTSLLALLAMWFGISLPLTFIGAYFGYKKKALEHPVRTNQIPRQIPDQTFYTTPIPSIIMGGILPFGCIFIQLFFILNSLWANQMYYMFGFLFIVFIILIITCSETSILLCYFHLCSEDYRWWWRAFFTSGSTSFYFFAYCINYFFRTLAIKGLASTFLYFGYTLILTFMFFLLTGTIGFFACYWFISKIYSVVKVD